MKLFHWFLVALFLLGASVQFNDPDPALWVPLYLFPALFAGLAATGRGGRWILIPAALYVIDGLTFLPHFRGAFGEVVVQMTDDTEFTREGLGLIFMGLLLVAVAFTARPKKNGA